MALGINNLTRMRCIPWTRDTSKGALKVYDNLKGLVYYSYFGVCLLFETSDFKVIEK